MGDTYIYYDVLTPEQPPPPDVVLVYARYFAARQGLAVPADAKPCIRPYPDDTGLYRVETLACHPS
ncbi:MULTISPECIES: hypothetical protein [Streptomyces]|uniref:Uncharacterized protein n=1 Tax=Streptomyces venezuelae (strain ATCC 10712 / CBS 650.69 / DSM 40230 / JCM 4526 / NBRC 13096 / PD 04745) TaxID=953739 RepID=F2RL33_STRVP|nr:hypothetical protein [Streptomyces venezuelae]APE21401.1 hypothetical protein vnz_10445 [Streptomyces venezuelae]QER98789.1 hypothetical protein DEJ43_10580 [Streptomyces venezuelae ATCC 10712]CCA55422.1 hypothetical protein SVEN_2136 [Streptomyces venezuelae ATCC 10712]